MTNTLHRQTGGHGRKYLKRQAGAVAARCITLRREVL